MDATDVVISDLIGEHLALQGLVEHLEESVWHTRTPASGWDVADSVSHLLFFDIRAARAMTDAEAFGADGVALMKIFAEGGDPSVALGRGVSGGELFTAWKEKSAALITAAKLADRMQRVPWYGPSMSVASFLTARLMETWAHGVDISDATGQKIVVSHRLKHIAHIGVLARANSYRANGLEVPEAKIGVVLSTPTSSVQKDEKWEWGVTDATETVTGSALDFCLLVTQRRHVADTDLVASGELGREPLTDRS